MNENSIDRKVGGSDSRASKESYWEGSSSSNDGLFSQGCLLTLAELGLITGESYLIYQAFNHFY